MLQTIRKLPEGSNKVFSGHGNFQMVQIGLIVPHGSLYVVQISLYIPKVGYQQFWNRYDQFKGGECCYRGFYNAYSL